MIKNNFMELDKLSAGRAVLKNALPAMISMIMALVYNMADLFFIGQNGDPLQSAAVTIATPVFILLMAIGNVFGIGGGALLARSLGAGDNDKVHKISSFCFWGVTSIGVITSLTMYFNMDSLVVLLGASEEVAELTSEYLRILCIGGALVSMSNCFSALIRSSGEAGKSMKGMLLGNFINIVLDPIFILHFNMGVKGAAIATVIANVIGVSYYFMHIFSKKTPMSVKLKDFTFGEGIAKNVMVIGIPASLASVLMSISQIIVNSQMAQYGDLAVAGAGVSLKTTMITNMLCVGIGMGVQPLLGFAIGANNKKRYSEIFRFSLKFSFLVGAVLTTFCYLNLDKIIGGFLPDPAAYEFAYSFARYYLATGVLFGLLFVITNALQAAGAASAALIVNVSRQGIFFIPLTFLMGGTLGMHGIVMAQPLADVLSFLLACVLYRVASKKMFVGNNGVHSIS